MEDLRLKLELELDEARAQIRGLREDIESVGTELSKAKIGLDTSEAKKQIEDLRGSLTSTKTEIEGVFNKFRDLPNAPIANKAGGDALTGINARLKELQANIAKVTGETRQGISIDNESREQIEAKVAALNNYRSALTSIRPEIESGTSTQLALENAIRNSTETIARFNGELNRRDASEALKQQRIEAEQFKNEFNQLEATFKKVANEQRSLIATNNLNAESQEKLAQAYRDIAQAQAQLEQANENDASRIKRLEVLTTSRITAEKKLSDEIKKQIAANSQADESAENRAQAEARLRAELDRVRIEIRDLDLERKKALATETLTEEALEGTISRYGQLEQRLKALRNEFTNSSRGTRQISTAQSQLFNATQRAQNGFTSLSGSIANSTKLQSQANQTVIEFSRGLSDAQQFAFGLQSGIIAVGNNISQLTEVGGRFVKSAGGIRGAFTQIASSLTGVGGVILAVNALGFALPFLGKAFSKNKEDVESANQALQDYNSILDKVRGSSSSDFLGLENKRLSIQEDKEFLVVLREIDILLKEQEKLGADIIGRRLNTQGQADISDLEIKLSLVNKQLEDYRKEYGAIADIPFDEIDAKIKQTTESIDSQEITLRKFANGVGAAYEDVQNILEEFQSSVDATGKELTAPINQFVELQRVSNGFVKQFSDDGVLNQAERSFLSWLDRIVKGAKDRVDTLETVVEEPVSELFGLLTDSDIDRIIKEVDALTEPIQEIPNIFQDIRNSIKKQSALIDVSILQDNFDEASKAIQDRYQLELDLIEGTVVGVEQVETAKLNALKNRLRAEEALLRGQSGNNPQIESARRLTAELAIIQAGSFNEAKKLIDDETNLRVKAAERTIKDKAVREAEIRRIEAEGVRDKANIESAKLDVVQQFGELGVSAISDFSDAATQIGLFSAKKTFNIQKALGVSQATIDAYRTISSIWADPLLPIPLKKSLSIAQGAAAFARVAKIASTKFGQSGSNSEASASASSFSEGFSFSDIQPSSPVVNVEADSFVDVLRNSQSNQSIVIENRVSNKEFYTLVKSGEGEVLASSQSASRDRFA